MPTKLGINLAALNSAIITTKKGNQALVIDLKSNFLEVHENGSIYFNLVAWENKKSNDYSTHFLKQDLPKEARESMDKDALYKLPIFGNMNLETYAAPAPTVNTVQATAAEVMPADADDLPF